MQQLLGQLTREPPTGFSRVTIHQAIRADRELFTIMAQELQDSVQPDARGNFPMEVKLKELRTDPRVTMFLLPMPKGSVKEPEKASPATVAPKVSSGTPTRPTKRPKNFGKGESHVPSRVERVCTKGQQRTSNLLGFQSKEWMQVRGQQWALQERDAQLHKMSQE